MKVNESYIAPNKDVTLLVLDGDMPSGHWNGIRVNGENHKTLYMSGDRLDQIAINGAYDLQGEDIEFVKM